MSTIYNRPVVTHINHLGFVAGAYKKAGLTPPSLGAEVQAKIQKAPSAESVARKLAEEALEVEDVDAWYPEALERIREAQSAELLRSEFNRAYPQIVQAAMPAYQAEATKDLQAPFNKLVKAFTEAVTQLPAGDAAFDAEAVIINDAGAALMTARDALAKFGTYAAIFPTPNSDNLFPADLNKILPLVELPPTVVEKVAGMGNIVQNESQLTETRHVRRIARDMRTRMPDLVLSGIARGEYGKARLSLAAPETLFEREARARTAHARERVELPTN